MTALPFHTLPRKIGTAFACCAVILLGACSAIKPPADTSAKALMPRPAGYTYADVTQNQSQLLNAMAGGAAVTGNLQVAAALKLVETVAGCYQRAGAYEAAVYQNQASPLEVGGVLLINNAVLSNPAVLAACFSSDQGLGGASATQPCIKRADFSSAGKSYTAFVGGSAPQVCDTLCNQLPGGVGVCR